MTNAIACQAGQRAEQQVLSDDGADDGVARFRLCAEAQEDGPLNDEVGDTIRALSLGIKQGRKQRSDPLRVETSADADSVEI